MEKKTKRAAQVFQATGVKGKLASPANAALVTQTWQEGYKAGYAEAWQSAIAWGSVRISPASIPESVLAEGSSEAAE